MKYEFRTLDQDTVNQLLALSQKWEAEDCTYGLVANEQSDLSEPLAVALDGDRIVGYIFGHFYTVKERTSYIQLGEKCFSVDELYVLPEYRSQGIGRQLFRRMEETVEAECTYITLSTATKNYKAVLHLYVEELGMNFHDAFLIKQTK